MSKSEGAKRYHMKRWQFTPVGCISLHGMWLEGDEWVQTQPKRRENLPNLTKRHFKAQQSLAKLAPDISEYLQKLAVLPHQRHFPLSRLINIGFLFDHALLAWRHSIIAHTIPSTNKCRVLWVLLRTGCLQTRDQRQSSLKNWICLKH